MKRSLRTTTAAPIIEISSSEDEENKKVNRSFDSPYNPVKSEVMQTGTIKTDKLLAKKPKIVKKKASNPKSPRNSPKKVKQVASRKRKVKEDPGTPETPEPIKKQKRSPIVSKSKIANKLDIKNVKKNSEETVTSTDYLSEWSIEDFISEEQGVDKTAVKTVVQLFEEENSIPFIARYRRAATGGLVADVLRAIKLSMERAKEIKATANNVILSIDKAGSWSPELVSIVKSVKSLEELKELHAIYKPPAKKSLVQVATDLGLQPLANGILQGQPIKPLFSYVDSNIPEIADEEKMCQTLMNLLVHNMMKNKAIIEKLQKFDSHQDIRIKTTSKTTTENKYKFYSNFERPIPNVKPHAVLAINRGEHEKCLSVQVVIPDHVVRNFENYCRKEYDFAMSQSRNHGMLLAEAIRSFCKNKFKAFVERRVRTTLKNKAEKEALEVFSRNLKQLLLIPPVRGKVILGVDPGFAHGCKLAMISEQGSLLDTKCIYPFLKKESRQNVLKAKSDLVDIVVRYNCTLIAIGNGTACRQAEKFISDLINEKVFGELEVCYTIVNEAGASVYSVGPEAKAEFPNLDPNLISAVSIARRLQDPLAELVKVDPQSLGIGMYQHDISNKELTSALDEVVSEAVSFVGVDINTASHCLLRRVAGITALKATKVMNYRMENGPFQNRQQILKIKGIGKKTFEQCAGFLKVIPETARKPGADSPELPQKKINLLDQTWIHPESYKCALDFINYCKCVLTDIGTAPFIEKIQACVSVTNYAVLAKKFSTDEDTMEIIVKALTLKKNEDCRPIGSYPIFRNGMISIADIKVGATVTGVARNITNFGVFVDIGVEHDGLIHTAKLKDNILNIGQSVEVKVISKEGDRRIGLEFMRLL